MTPIFGASVSRGLQTGIRQAIARSPRQLSYLRTAPPRLRKQSLPKTTTAQALRFQSDDAPHRPLTDSPRSTGAVNPDHTPESEAEREARKALEPAYQITFTCRRCMGRSSHRISKQSYHHGTTLITCPSCKNRHIISDHLKIFSDRRITIEDIMKEKGEFLKKGRLGEDGDIEFYADPETNEVKDNVDAELERNGQQKM